MNHGESVKELQTLLNQQGAKLDPDGWLGNETKKAISSLNIPYYLKVALLEVGTKEIHGTLNNPRIIEYHKVSGGFSNDEVPWCGSFVNWVMLQSNYDTVKTPARAKSWLNFGIETDYPMPGAIAVKSRTGDKSRTGNGHVCFVLGYNQDGKLLCVGGNQNDEVNIKAYDKSVFLEFRVPENLIKYKMLTFNMNSTSTREA